MRSIDNNFYHSSEWRECRKKYLVTVNGLCERCLKKGLYTPADIVHHKIYLSPENYLDSEFSLSFKNLEAVCYECHNQEHSRKKNKDRRYVVGEHGEIVILDDQCPQG